MQAEQHKEVVVITGASGGIGRATVQAFAKRGARIGLIARGHAGLEGALNDVRALGGEGIILPVDVSDATAVDDAAQKVEDTFGPIDIWVNDAFTSIFAPFTEISPQDYKRVTEVSYLGFVYG
ncbi:MAG TPA: SDR family NAD(P)-dependent oxidoreductase, partial [Ktedonobacterales bacterium]|nr:SDR family NAD(P)-dependent oxidoreductase [Ktedonobacterales bacterium]